VIRQFVVPANFDPSCQNDRDPVANLTGPRQDLIGAKGAQPGETTHPLDVSRFEDRKYLIRLDSMIDLVGTDMTSKLRLGEGFATVVLSKEKHCVAALTGERPGPREAAGTPRWNQR